MSINTFLRVFFLIPLFAFWAILPEIPAQLERKTTSAAASRKVEVAEKLGTPTTLIGEDMPKFALLVGINNYRQRTIPSLRGAVNDTRFKTPK